MKHSNLLCVLLAVALVILTIKITFMDHSATTNNTPQENTSQTDAVMDNILTRTSIRQYTDEALTETQVENLLRAGMAAPSAMNKQPWRFVVVQDKDQLANIASGIGPAKAAAQAAALIVVCGDMTQAIEGDGRDFWVQDCSAVMENILLAAHAMKLGAVWLGGYPIEERCDALKTALGMPDDIVPLGMIAVGHPAESPAPKDKWKPENVHYDKW